jgi:RHH-type proline utilization regulon transcriptional repressor/proline dehydrogenase/delta 1-pyrroline-5-carboxylate dehydrogenase
MTTQIPRLDGVAAPAPRNATPARTPEPDVTRRFSAAPGSTTDIPAGLADEAVALVRRWLTEAAKVPVDASAKQLAGVLKDPDGLAFTVGFVDGVIRPEDLSVAARNLAAIAPKVPKFLPWYMRSAVTLGTSSSTPRTPASAAPSAGSGARGSAST